MTMWDPEVSARSKGLCRAQPAKRDDQKRAKATGPAAFPRSHLITGIMRMPTTVTLQ